MRTSGTHLRKTCTRPYKCAHQAPSALLISNSDYYWPWWFMVSRYLGSNPSCFPYPTGHNVVVTSRYYWPWWFMVSWYLVSNPSCFLTLQVTMWWSLVITTGRGGSWYLLSNPSCFLTLQVTMRWSLVVTTGRGGSWYLLSNPSCFLTLQVTMRWSLVITTGRGGSWYHVISCLTPVVFLPYRSQCGGH